MRCSTVDEDLNNNENDSGAPLIQWDGHTFIVALPMSGGGTLTAEWQPETTYTTRIREAHAGDWSVGFETPVGGGTFRGLEPDTEYEVEVSIQGPAGDIDPLYVRFRTDPEGEGGEVIPFPNPNQ